MDTIIIIAFWFIFGTAVTKTLTLIQLLTGKFTDDDIRYVNHKFFFLFKSILWPFGFPMLWHLCDYRLWLPLKLLGLNFLLAAGKPVSIVFYIFMAIACSSPERFIWASLPIIMYGCQYISGKILQQYLLGMEPFGPTPGVNHLNPQ